MQNNYLIVNVQLVNEDKISFSHVLIQDGFIKNIYPQSIAIEDIPFVLGTKIIDACGKYLLPGLIDEHVHFRQPGMTNKGDIYTESRAALVGGVTSIMDMPNVLPQTTTNNLLNDRFLQAKDKMFCNYSFYLAVTDTNFEEVKHVDKNRVAGLKLFVGSSTGNMLISDEAVLEKVFAIKDLPIAVHAEDETIIKENTSFFKQKYGEKPPFSVHNQIRSTKACVEASKKVIARAERLGTHLHILHISTQEELKLLANSSANITGEICPSYLCFDENDYANYGAKIKCNPAIKTKNDRLALLQAVANGEITTIGSDHAPHLWEEKDKSYFQSPSGMPMVQHTLLVLLDLVKANKLKIEQLVKLTSHNPSLLYGIDRRGFIKEGYFADMVLVDLQIPTKVSTDNIYYKCAWSPFEGKTFSSSVEKTFVNGVLVYDKGIFANENPAMELYFNR